MKVGSVVLIEPLIVAMMLVPCIGSTPAGALAGAGVLDALPGGSQTIRNSPKRKAPSRRSNARRDQRGEAFNDLGMGASSFF